MLICLTYSLEKLARLYLKEVVKLHGVPTVIISDQDARFTSHFKEAIQQVIGTRLRYITALHP